MARKIIANHFSYYSLGVSENDTVSLHIETSDYGNFLAYIEDGVLYVEEYCDEFTTVIKHVATNYHVRVTNNGI